MKEAEGETISSLSKSNNKKEGNKNDK